MTRAALVPGLYVSDLAASLVFYLDVLGFQIEFDRPEDKFVCLRLGEARLMLEEARSLSKSTAAEFESAEWRLADLERPFGRGMNLEIEVEDIVATDHRLRERGIAMLLPLHEKTYRVSVQSDYSSRGFWSRIPTATSFVSRSK
jgi:catechol 2,3-dioxygenase-like lactoylglutathione lyase family enzyme